SNRKTPEAPAPRMRKIVAIHPRSVNAAAWECYDCRAMAINYASENLFKAVLYSMRSTEPLQERLRGCYEIFHVLSQKGHLPPDLQKRFDVMIEAWTMMPDDT